MLQGIVVQKWVETKKSEKKCFYKAKLEETHGVIIRNWKFCGMLCFYAAFIRPSCYFFWRQLDHCANQWQQKSRGICISFLCQEVSWEFQHGPEEAHVYEPQAMWIEWWIVVPSTKLRSPENFITQKMIYFYLQSINSWGERLHNIYGKIGQCTYVQCWCFPK